MRGVACDGCMMSVLMTPVDESAFDEGEIVALAALVEEGLLPPLRLVPGTGSQRAGEQPPGAGRRVSATEMFADSERVV